jgi:hypothetical protein
VPGQSHYPPAGTNRASAGTVGIARLIRAMTDARGSLVIHARIVASVLSVINRSPLRRTLECGHHSGRPPTRMSPQVLLPSSFEGLGLTPPTPATSVLQEPTICRSEADIAITGKWRRPPQKIRTPKTDPLLTIARCPRCSPRIRGGVSVGLVFRGDIC